MHIRIPKRKITLFSLLGCVFIPLSVAAVLSIARIGVQPDGSILIPTGQTITPAGGQIDVNDRPLGIALSPDGEHAAVVTCSNFQTRALHIVDLATQMVVQKISLGGAFVGIAYSPDGKTLYIGGGTDNDVKIFSQGPDGQWVLGGAVSIPSSQPSGLSLSPTGDKLYVALNTATGFAIVDTASRAVTKVTTGAFPYTTVTIPGKVYISNWAGRLPDSHDATDGTNPVVVDPATGIANNGTISVYDLTSNAVIKDIQVGLHPSAMALSPDGGRLYVANANSDSISIIRTDIDVVDRTIDVRPAASAPLGSSPNAIAVSRDGKTLYVANAANNSIAVVQPDIQGNPVRGFVPVGWYPTALALTLQGDRLLVGNGYGFGSIAPPAPTALGHNYADRSGEISVIPVPVGEALLKAYTRQTSQNNASIGGGKSSTPLNPPGSSPIPAAQGGSSPIKHIIYVIKENRTYDQVFGDMPAGNGDPNLAIFGSSVTPNHHAIASQFVLLDNFFGPGDQSSLGHQWCDESYPTDYGHKYGNGRNDFAGTNPMAFAPTGFLWDNALAHGKTARIYGEFGNSTVIAPSTATWTDFFTAWQNHTPGPTIHGVSSVKSAQKILAPGFPGYNLKIAEQIRADLFLEEFAQFQRSGSMPNLIVLEMPIDHTQGTTAGYPTPRAMVADNDLAVGRVVDAVSHSRFWASTAIFIIEDDTQDGVDHVDGHREPVLIVSPYTRRGGFVDSTFYTIPNMFRTIEQILGLPPLNQYDRAAQTMTSTFSGTPDLTPFNAVPNQIALNEMNPPVSALRGLQRQLAIASAKMDFSEADAAPEDLLNRVIWHSVKGYNTPYPVRTTKR